MTQHFHVASACHPPADLPPRLFRPRAKVASTVTQHSQHDIEPDLYRNGDNPRNVEVDAS